MSESDKIQTFFKRALGVVSTFKGTPWYNEVNGRQRNIIEAKDINIEKTPEIPEWSDSSLNSTTMEALGFYLSDSDFASSDSSFTKLHLYDDDTGTYEDDGGRFPGMYLDESVIDSSGVVALFVRLKLDKMEGDENLDPSAIVYTKHERNYTEKRTSSPVVSWDGSNLSLIDTDTELTIKGSSWEKYYGDSLSDYVDFSTAVATTDINKRGTGDDHSFNTVVLYQTTEVFMLRRSVWTGADTVSTDGWSLIATDKAFITYFDDINFVSSCLSTWYVFLIMVRLCIFSKECLEIH